MTELHHLTLAELNEGLRARRFSSVEITRHYLARLERLNPALNAVITVTAEQALAAAQRADRLLAAGEAGALAGLPILHKDIFCTDGVLTTCGSRMLSNFVAPYDATLVERLSQSGVVMLGKANMDEFAMGSSNETSWFGPVKNPWDLKKVPGGSSGGRTVAYPATG
jgi:aspartyl-tRNA(Asn)/glutamyl-tRNA(Gln) amidotransferase subunit A